MISYSSIVQGCVLAASAALLVGCGDSADASGALGRINYSLQTRYILDSNSLTDATIVTGHVQQIGTRLTSKGNDDTDTPELIRHRMEPSIGVTVSDADDGFDVPDVDVTVTDPGDYTLSSYIDDTQFDYVQLRFGTPTQLEMVTWLRSPTGQFEKQGASENYAVQEGAQVTFLPIPTDDNNNRLVGDMDFNVSVVPATAAVAVQNVEAIYEQGVYYSTTPLSLVFIEPGDVVINVIDTAEQVTGEVKFTVTAAGQ